MRGPLRCVLKTALVTFAALMVGSTSMENKAQAETPIVPATKPTQPSEPQKVYRRTDDRVVVNPQRLTSSKIRKFESKRMVLYSDIEDQNLAASIPKLADALFERLTEYYGALPPSRQGGEFQTTGYLMANKSAFQSLGLLTDRVPQFENARHLKYEFWANAQDFEYYTRHLVLHEFTHCFMTCVTGSTNAPPPWYMEGMAEYFATHRITKDGPVFGVMPENKKDYQGFGRTTFINRAVASGTGHRLAKVMQVKPTDPAIYPWSWAACWFFTEHPKYGPSFRRIGNHNSYASFMQKFAPLVGNDSAKLEIRWHEFINQLVDGYDLTRGAVTMSNCKPLVIGGSTKFVLQANQGWQSTGVQLEANAIYTVQLAGRFQVNDKPKPWMSEPNGVSIQYVQGKRLGCVLGAIVQLTDRDSLSKAMEIGSNKELQNKTGDLYLRINDAMNSLANNAGTATATITRTK